MGTKNVIELRQLRSGATVPQCWSLAPGHAISLQPAEAGALRIARGQVWATFDGPHRGHGNELGDLFLQAGQQLGVSAGQRVVFEPWGGDSETPVYFDWTPDCAAALGCGSRWNATVVHPLGELRQALAIAGPALARLGMGLAGYGEFLVAGRGRVMPKLEANQP